MKLLMISMDDFLVASVSRIMRERRYLMDVADVGDQGRQMAQSGIYDLIVLDQTRHGDDSVPLLKSLRRCGFKTPVLVLSGVSGPDNCVECLDAGADDYMAKPFDENEMLARLRALGRRATDMWDNEIIEFGRIRCTPARCEIFCHGEITRLTLKETQILECLLRNRNRVVSREQLVQRIWGYNCEVEMNTLEVTMSYLRKKLKNTRSGVVIKTIRGIGYCLSEEASQPVSG